MSARLPMAGACAATSPRRRPDGASRGTGTSTMSLRRWASAARGRMLCRASASPFRTSPPSSPSSGRAAAARPRLMRLSARPAGAHAGHRPVPRRRSVEGDKGRVCRLSPGGAGGFPGSVRRFQPVLPGRPRARTAPAALRARPPRAEDARAKAARGWRRSACVRRTRSAASPTSSAGGQRQRLMIARALLLRPQRR